MEDPTTKPYPYSEFEDLGVAVSRAIKNLRHKSSYTLSVDPTEMSLPTLQNRLNWRQTPLERRPEQQFILIRLYQPGDEVGCKKIIHEGIMATVLPAFFTALTREVTFEIIIIMAAFMFVFMGLSPTICLLSIPISVLIIYLCVYISHISWAYSVADEVSNIPKYFMSSHFTGFWVAEAYEPYSQTSEPSQLKYPILNESQLNGIYREDRLFSKRIIGTVAVEQNRQEGESAWLRRMAVSSKYQRKGVGTALLNEALNFCQKKGYEYVILVASECHEAAKKLSLKKGFELRQLYHKQFLGSLVQVLMYEFSYKIPTRENISLL